MNSFLFEKESDWLDRKREYPENNISLIHDILCLANAHSSSHRYLIFGIADDKAVVGIEDDLKRKKQSDILTILKDSHFNRLPIISLNTVSVDNHEIDILEIENRPDKPYYLKKDKDFQGKTIRAGVIYTRYGDTNTPLKECSDELFVERMFRERFGIDKTPLERIKLSLRSINNWKWGENEKREEYFYDELNPEFQFYRSHESSDFVEGWSLSFPDSRAFKHELFLKFHDTLLKRLHLVSCDGERYLTVLPEIWLKQDPKDGCYYQSHFFIQDSLEYLANEMIQQVHPVLKSYRGWLEPFPIFSSQESAKMALEADYAKGMLKYTYYFFDRQSQCHHIVRNGNQVKITTI